MTTYTYRLSHESVVIGPRVVREHPDLKAAIADAREWADGQTGHPWDHLTIEDEEFEYEVDR